jgi:hypothetical protein
MKIHDFIGKRFNNLLVISRAENTKHGGSRWLCKCNCGGYCTTTGSSLVQNQVECKRCADIRRRKTNAPSYLCEYRIWLSMKQRCENKKCAAYSGYGGRGITVCDRWLASFENFITDMGLRPSINHSIDRINNNGNYEPSNCRWATRKEQARNIRSNRLLEFNGQTKCISEWAEIYGISVNAIDRRLKEGQSVNDAIELPNSRQKTIVVNGINMRLYEADKLLGFANGTISSRLRRGFSKESAVSRPVLKRKYL